MKEDTNMESTDIVAIAAIPNQLDDMWSVFIINQGDLPLEMVMVSSRGYGEIDGVKKETATLRWKLGDIKVGDCCLIEELAQEVCSLNNEFMITFFCDNKLIDKKVVFGANTIHSDSFEEIPILNKKGVLFR